MPMGPVKNKNVPRTGGLGQLSLKWSGGECAFILAMESFLNTALLCRTYKFLSGKKSRIEVSGEHTLSSSFEKVLADVAEGAKK